MKQKKIRHRNIPIEVLEEEHRPEDFIPLYPFVKADMKIIRERIKREREAKKKGKKKSYMSSNTYLHSRQP